ncbi:DNA-directed RNA polymerase III subunit RPC4 isoform X1 [Anomalospiza imberbis]|uniref:DNA-directed RNA polymerase III subunit RPC4 isoform X1 n=1 Tax=Anomalospiza imberbis TaxID=187417 RepID=UPI00358EF01F
MAGLTVPCVPVVVLSVPCAPRAVLSVPCVTRAVLSVPCAPRAVLSVPCATRAVLSVPCVTGAVLSVPCVTRAVLSVPCARQGSAECPLCPQGSAECPLCHRGSAECPLCPRSSAECPLCPRSSAECPLCPQGSAECPLCHQGGAECPLCHRGSAECPLCPQGSAECPLCHRSSAECPLCHQGSAECPLCHRSSAECPLCPQDVLSVPCLSPQFLDDPGLKNDIRNKPVQLPLAHSGWLFKEEVAEQEDTQPWLPASKEEKMELDPPAVKVKEEPREEDPRPSQPKGPPGFPRDVSAAELLQRLSLAAEEELVFLQLPDTLPGQPPSHDSKPSKSELHSEDGQVLLVKQEKSQEAKQAENICTLADLPEGQVGKLLIRKSGKVQLVLGKVTLDVTMGTPCSFLQELVSVGIGDNRTGEMIVLGHVRHKLVCSPDFEALLEHRHR